MRRKPGETRALLLQFLEDHHHIFGRMPTTKQALARLQISGNTLVGHLKRLERDGKITFPPRGTLPVNLKPQNRAPLQAPEGDKKSPEAISARGMRPDSGVQI